MYSGLAVEPALRGAGAAHPGREQAAAGLRDVGSTRKQPQSPVEGPKKSRRFWTLRAQGPEIPAVLDTEGARS